MNSSLAFNEAARFPLPGDNAAIAQRDLKHGTVLNLKEGSITLQHDILTGHRFATKLISKDSFITSWNYPFGTAARDIQPGEYLCNKNVLFRLSIQEDELYTSLKLPEEPNFNDDIEPYEFDTSAWKKPTPVQSYSENRTFRGYDRGERGAGTRNQLVILNTSASTAPLVEKLESDFKGQADSLENIDAIIGLRHTEDKSPLPEEQERTLRTLAGLITNPNIGGFIAIESGQPGELTNTELIDWMSKNNLPVDAIPHQLLATTDSFEADLDAGKAAVAALITQLNSSQRAELPVSLLNIGLQCGASDAFSGICGNVLSAAIAREIIRYGGLANLTETPELSGAEDYTLSSIDDPSIATRFLSMLDRFKEHLGWHGGKVDKNPSEGNLLGGLYNITLKSLGAAVKRDPQIPISHIIEYGERMSAPGYYFMDGMGGDIASYTGQAAAGCNIVLFVTGRGTPTNSSIVPTVKIVNTTGRYKLMAGDIDINAGRYLDGESMDDLTADSLDQIIRIASGEKTKGEHRDQFVDLIWRRKYFQKEPENAAENQPTRFSGLPLAAQPPEAPALKLKFDGLKSENAILPKTRTGLIIPTVGCSYATAQQAADQLNRSELVSSGRITRFVVLTNTEGCGVTTGSEMMNFILSFATHSQVEACLFLSLGCEMVSPSFIKSAMRGEDIGFPEITQAVQKAKLDPERFGWLTIQESGGTEHTLTATVDWFHKKLQTPAGLTNTTGTACNMKIGLMASSALSAHTLDQISEFARHVITAGGSVVIPQCCAPLQTAHLFTALPATPSLAFAQSIESPGLHVMQSITNNQIEQVTGLGAATDVIINFSDDRPVTAHTLTPTLNITSSSDGGDFDLQLIAGQESKWPQQLADITCSVLSGTCWPRQNALGHSGNQIPRGPRAHAI
ncbi:MAG: UxaA family hydrolase [Verrucomicrobiota bacterium]